MAGWEHINFRLGYKRISVQGSRLERRNLNLKPPARKETSRRSLKARTKLLPKPPKVGKIMAQDPYKGHFSTYFQGPGKP